MTISQEALADVLKQKGFRATKGRMELLALLARAGRPLSIQGIAALWKAGGAPDQATLYRSLADLSAAGVVRRIDLNTGIAHFEYTPDRPHHHHLVCTECGKVEEIEECSVHTLEKKILRESTRFARIATHNLEFYGACNACAITHQ